MTATWEQTKAAAATILGKGAKIPDPKQSVDKYDSNFLKALGDYRAAVAALDDKIAILQGCDAAFGTMIKQFQDQVSKSDFGLHASDGDAKSRIAKARELIHKFLELKLQVVDLNIKNLEELDRHSKAIAKYQPPK